MDALILGIFGCIVGSFLNVAVLRREVHTLGGRSACMSCGEQLRWYDMVPVFSWLYLHGKCRVCESGISVQYPLVELLTGVLFAVLGLSIIVEEPLALVVALIILATLVAISVYDIRHTIIPDSWAYLFAACALVYAFITGIPDGGNILLFALAGPVAALPIFTLWLVSRGTWIGLGDAKLCLGIGWLLGPVYGIVAVFFAFVIGAVISVFVLMPLPSILSYMKKQGIARFRVRTHQLTMKSEVPFGPFLVASCIIVWFSLLFNLPLPW
jgi:leader peptidase (prepilin peptidase) / N-methyltransferase